MLFEENPIHILALYEQNHTLTVQNYKTNLNTFSIKYHVMVDDYKLLKCMADSNAVCL